VKGLIIARVSPRGLLALLLLAALGSPAQAMPPWKRQSDRTIDEALGSIVRRHEPIPENLGSQVRKGMTYEQVTRNLGKAEAYRFGKETWLLFGDWDGIGLRFEQRGGRMVATGEWTYEGLAHQGLKTWDRDEEARLNEETARAWGGPGLVELKEAHFLPRLPNCLHPIDADFHKLTIRYRGEFVGYLPTQSGPLAIIGGYWNPSRKRLILLDSHCGNCCLPVWSCYRPSRSGRLVPVELPH